LGLIHCVRSSALLVLEFGLLIVKVENEIVSVMTIYIKKTLVSAGCARVGRVSGRPGLTRPIPSMFFA